MWSWSLASDSHNEVVLGLGLEGLGIHGETILFVYLTLMIYCNPFGEQISSTYFDEDTLINDVKSLSTSRIGELFVGQLDITM